MKKLGIIVVLASVLVGGSAVVAAADPTTDVTTSLALEGAYGLPAGDQFVSVYPQAYYNDIAGSVETVVAATFFVDGSSTLECFGITSGTVSIETDLSEGSYTASLSGTCFDFGTEESVPFTASLDIDGVGTGLVRTRAGSYADDGKRCVSQIRSRSATGAGTVGLSVPDRGINASGAVTDTQSELRSFEQRCYPMNGQPAGQH